MKEEKIHEWTSNLQPSDLHLKPLAASYLSKLYMHTSYVKNNCKTYEGRDQNSIHCSDPFPHVRTTAYQIQIGLLFTLTLCKLFFMEKHKHCIIASSFPLRWTSSRKILGWVGGMQYRWGLHSSYFLFIFFLQPTENTLMREHIAWVLPFLQI